MKSDLNQLRIASPCPANWEGMKGDDRVRFCELCNLHVYNFAELTRSEAASLVANTEGRICARLYRRADGMVITKDCPVGLRALRRRVARVAGAAFAALMSLGSVVVGQEPSKKNQSGKHVTITKKVWESEGDKSVLSGTILDPNGAVISGAKIAIIDQNRKSTNTESNQDGQFRVSGLLPGTYEVMIESPNFKNLNVIDIMLDAKESLSLEVLLEVNTGISATMGVVGLSEPLIDTPGKPVINEKIILRRPH